MSSKISEPKNTKFDRFKGEPGGLVIVHEIEVYLTISMCLVYLTRQYVLQPFSNFFFFFGGGGGGGAGHILMSSSVPNGDSNIDLFKHTE